MVQCPRDDRQMSFGGSGLRGITAVASKSPSVVAAIVEFCFGRLIANPQQIGHALGCELSGWRSARVGQYRVIYWIDESERIV
jgi:mRNA-degrading endonuclease RelE of RelBE toxin-antitoxin system